MSSLEPNNFLHKKKKKKKKDCFWLFNDQKQSFFWNNFLHKKKKKKKKKDCFWSLNNQTRVDMP